MMQMICSGVKEKAVGFLESVLTIQIPMEPAVPYHQPLLPTWQKALIWKPA